ncbi:hypothetical protein MHYP_G00078060 [Metynnis hypsauchen]
MSKVRKMRSDERDQQARARPCVILQRSERSIRQKPAGDCTQARPNGAQGERLARTGKEKEAREIDLSVWIRSEQAEIDRCPRGPAGSIVALLTGSGGPCRGEQLGAEHRRSVPEPLSLTPKHPPLPEHV